MKLLKTLCLLVLSTSVLFTGCMSDDQSDCPPKNNLTLAFSYLNFPTLINRVTVGIYDANALLVDKRQVEKNELDVFQGLVLNLPPGNYTAVCWGNTFDKTQINGLALGDNMTLQKVAHPGCFSNTTIPTNDVLYYGMHTFTIEEDKATNEIIPFTPAHIRLIVQVKGLASTAPGAPAADYPYIKVNDLLPTYDYQMVPSGNPTTYYPHVNVDAVNTQAESRLNVLRFKDINPITIDVIENTTTNNILHTVNLQAFMTAIGLTITDGAEVTIPILVTFSGAGGVNVTVTLIEDWGNIPVDPLPQG